MSIVAEWIPKPWGIFLVFISFLIPLTKIAIDSYKMNAIERIRLTNVGQVMIFGSQVVVVSIIIGSLIFLFMLNDMNFIKENDVFIIILSSFIVSFLLVFMSFTTVYSVVKMFSIKTKFYILFNREKLTIVRKIDKKIYLLKGKNNKHLFFEADKLLNKEIYEELESKPKHKGFMFWLNKHSIVILLASVLATLVGVVLIEYFRELWFGSLMLIISILFFLLIAVNFKNQEDVQRLSKK